MLCQAIGPFPFGPLRAVGVLALLTAVISLALALGLRRRRGTPRPLPLGLLAVSAFAALLALDTALAYTRTVATIWQSHFDYSEKTLAPFATLVTHYHVLGLLLVAVAGPLLLWAGVRLYSPRDGAHTALPTATTPPAA